MVFSEKQRRVLTWWRPGSPERERQAVICDGAVRSGKTLCTGLSFFCWAMSSFQNRNFALCGRTIRSVRRNLLSELIPLLEKMGFRCEQRLSENLILVRLGGKRNRFYLFGGKDESSAALIQGITLAGALLDEAVPLDGLPPISIVLSPSAPGTAVQQNSSAVIDYSNAKDGYIMIKWTGGSTSSKIKVLIKGPNNSEDYQYNLRTDGSYDTFPLSDGNGQYSVRVYKQVDGTKYSPVLTAKVSAQLTDEFAPFIRPNQYVNYSDDSKAVTKAAEIIPE